MEKQSAETGTVITILHVDRTYEAHGFLRLTSQDYYDDMVFGGLSGGERITPQVVLKEDVVYLRIPISFTRPGRGRHFLAGAQIKVGSNWRRAANDVQTQGCERDSFEDLNHESRYLNAPALFLFPESTEPFRTYTKTPFVIVGELSLPTSEIGLVRVVRHRNSLCFKLTRYTEFFYHRVKGKCVPIPQYLYCDPLRTIICTPMKLRLGKYRPA